MKVYIVDYLGQHAGMHYYLTSFKSLLESGGIEVHILSNFSNNGRPPFFLYQYEGSVFHKMKCLIANYYRFRKFIANHPEECVIFLSYGNGIDIPFIRALTKVKHHMLDVHEAITQHLDSNRLLINSFKAIYRNKVRSVIIHSERTNNYLQKFGFKGYLLSVPHFEYKVPTTYNLTNIGDDVKSAYSKSRKNYLFFGSLTYDKGVDLLIDTFNHLGMVLKHTNLVVAGKDFDGAVKIHKIKNEASVKIISRHINDDEMAFLYHGTDFVCLPYRKTSQSGVLEMAFHFKKPIIATDIPYFRTMLERFPSFGILAKSGDYKRAIEQSVTRERNFYISSEYKNYLERKEFKDFINNFKNWLNAK